MQKCHGESRKPRREMRSHAGYEMSPDLLAVCHDDVIARNA